MENLSISSTKTIPQVDFNGETGEMIISGRSLPEQAHELFKPMLEWIDLYSNTPKSVTKLSISLEYINSSSNKYLLLILKSLEELAQKGSQVEVIWYYEENDEDTKEAGEEYLELLKIPMNIVQIG